MEIIPAREVMLLKLVAMYKAAIAQMENNNIFQWDDIYPNEAVLKNDIKNGELFAVTHNGELVAAYVVNTKCDDEYINGSWTGSNKSYRVIHRLCVNPKYQRRGIARKIMLHIENKLRESGVYAIRLDAFAHNPYALALYNSLGYKTVGFADWRKGRFMLMEKVIIMKSGYDETHVVKENK